MELHDPAKDLASAIQNGHTIAEYRKGLPIFARRQELLYLIEGHQVVIVIGQTGSGKTTQLPQFLYEAGWSSPDKMIPRKVAAISVAGRVAEEMGCPLGDLVGYTVRHEDRSSAGKTQIKFMTDGLLFRELIFDPTLSRYSVIMIDEAHERSLHTDLLLAALKKILKQRSDLRIIISSATIDADRFVDFFKSEGRRTAKTVSGPTLPTGERLVNRPQIQPQIIHLEGAVHSIGICYSKTPLGRDYVEAAVRCVLTIHRSGASGDILVFLPGFKEINEAIQSIKEQASSIYALPLHASLPPHQQVEVFKAPPTGKRKVLLSTNIAETSVTIEGISFVVDSGLVKRKVYDPTLGISRMILTRISKSSARQRAGRTGRTCPGKVFRLYSKEEHDYEMLDYSPPDIQLVNLAPSLLQMMALGICNFLKFDFIDTPSAKNISAGLRTLQSLEAVDDYGNLTQDIGTVMSELAVEPYLAKMLIKSKEYRCSYEIVKIVAMLSVGDIFISDISDEIKRKQSVEEGDLLSSLNIFNAYRENVDNASKWCQRHYVNLSNLQKADRFCRQLSGHLKHFGIDPMVSAGKDPVPILKCILSGLFYNLAQAQLDGTYRLVRAPDLALNMHPDSVLFKRVPQWVVFEEAVETTKLFMVNVSVVEKDWVTEVAPHYFKGVRR